MNSTWSFSASPLPFIFVVCHSWVAQYFFWGVGVVPLLPTYIRLSTSNRVESALCPLFCTKWHKQCVKGYTQLKKFLHFSLEPFSIKSKVFHQPTVKDHMFQDPVVVKNSFLSPARKILLNFSFKWNAGIKPSGFKLNFVFTVLL